MTVSKQAAAGTPVDGRTLPPEMPTSPAAAPPWCVSCELRPASVLLPFPADVPRRFPAQVFPLCGSCASIAPPLEEYGQAGESE